LPLGSPGISGKEPKNDSCSASEPKHRTAVLFAIPRGSHDTTSNRARSWSENSHGHFPRSRSRCRPDAPGPPKFTKSVPILCVGSVAGSLISARSIFAPDGRS